MADDDRRDEAIFAETLAGFGTRPVLDGAAEPVEPEDTKPDWQPDEEPGGPDESRFDRLAAGLRWAAAPLGFFLFLAALTAYGVLRDRAGDTADSPSPAPAATTEMPSTTAPPPTTGPPAAVTTVPTTAPPVPTTSAPAVVPATTVPPVQSGPGPARVTPTTAPAARYGPVCGYEPGEIVDVSINGVPVPPATADADGCVSVSR